MNQSQQFVTKTSFNQNKNCCGSKLQKNQSKMIFQNFIKNTKSCLSNAELGEAIKLMKSFLEVNKNPDYGDGIITLESRYNRNKNNDMLGFEPSDFINAEWNKITYSLTKLLRYIETEFKVSTKREALKNAFSMANPKEISTNSQNPADWNNLRRSTYTNSEGVLLVHTLWPSKEDNQDFDIYIYLIKHKSGSLEEIEYAEFFFGKMWDNKIFKVENKDNKIGIYTAAYGPFLCLCKVKFKSGKEIFIDRYIDFEQGELITNELIE